MVERAKNDGGDMEQLLREHRANVLRTSSLDEESKARERQLNGLSADNVSEPPHDKYSELTL